MNPPQSTTAAPSNPLVLVTLCTAWLVRVVDAHSLMKMDSMSPLAYIEYRHHLFEHSYLFAFIILLIGGGFYLGVVETVTYLIRGLVPKTRSN